MARCVNCGMKIEIQKSVPGWVSNPELIGNWQKYRKEEPWFTACPGSKENLDRWPTFGAWAAEEDSIKRNTTRYGTEHEPMDSLIEAAQEAVNNGIVHVR